MGGREEDEADASSLGVVSFAGGVFEVEPSAIAVAVSPAGDVAVVADLPGARVVARADAPVASRPRGDDRLLFATSIGGSLVAASTEGSSLVVGAADRSSPSTRTPVGGPLAGIRRATSGDSLYLYVATTTHEGPVLLHRFDVRSGTIRRRAFVVDRKRDDLSREIAAVTANADGFALLYRRGAPEDAQSEVVVATERGFVAVEALRDLGLLEVLERHDDELVVVGSFEFDRPRAFRLDLRGRLVDATRIAPGERPSFVRSPGRAEIHAERSRVVFRARDVAGDVVTERSIPRGSGETPPAIARTGEGFAVAFTEARGDGWGLRVVRIPEEVPR